MSGESEFAQFTATSTATSTAPNPTGVADAPDGGQPLAGALPATTVVGLNGAGAELYPYLQAGLQPGLPAGNGMGFIQGPGSYLAATPGAAGGMYATPYLFSDPYAAAYGAGWSGAAAGAIPAGYLQAGYGAPQGAPLDMGAAGLPGYGAMGMGPDGLLAGMPGGAGFNMSNDFLMALNQPMGGAQPNLLMSQASGLQPGFVQPGGMPTSSGAAAPPNLLDPAATQVLAAANAAANAAAAAAAAGSGAVGPGAGCAAPPGMQPPLAASGAPVSAAPGIALPPILGAPAAPVAAHGANTKGVAAPPGQGHPPILGGPSPVAVAAAAATDELMRIVADGALAPVPAGTAAPQQPPVQPVQAAPAPTPAPAPSKPKGPPKPVSWANVASQPKKPGEGTAAAAKPAAVQSQFQKKAPAAAAPASSVAAAPTTAVAAGNGSRKEPAKQLKGAKQAEGGAGGGKGGKRAAGPGKPKRWNQQQSSQQQGVAIPAEVLAVIPHGDTDYNPTSFNCKPTAARSFVIKSYSEEDVHKSIKFNVWTSTQHGNKRLDAAFRGSRAPVFLFFSVNASGHFCGIAQMMSEVDYDKCSGHWAQEKWKSEFKVKWIFVKDVPNREFRHIRLATNENKPVTNSRDTQEVPLTQAKQVMQIIRDYRSTTSVFDDFLYYEQEPAAPAATTTSTGATPKPTAGGLKKKKKGTGHRHHSKNNSTAKP